MLNEAFSAGARPGKVILKYYSNAIITTSCPLPGFYDFDRNFRFELPLPSEAYARPSCRLKVKSPLPLLGGIAARFGRSAFGPEVPVNQTSSERSRPALPSPPPTHEPPTVT